LAICGETDALVDCGDKAALADYAAWLLRQKAEEYSFGGDGIFGPLCRHAGDPAVAAAAETIFNGPESPWNPVLGKSRGSVHNLGPLIVLEAVRKQALRELKDKTVIGKTVAEGTSGHVEVPGTGLGLDAPPEDPLHPAAGTTLPLRQCDFYAWQLSCMPGFPECEPYWPEAKRDETIAACAAYLQKYGSYYQPAAADPMFGFRGGAQLVLPPLDHPATARDVAEGRAIFSLEGQGESRVVKTVHLPQNAQWKTYKGAGLTGGRATNPKTGKDEMTVRYLQDGTVWQAEEVLKDGKWQRYYGFVGRYCLARVPSAELEFANENGSPAAK
jgi:hypothetical protein